MFTIIISEKGGAERREAFDKNEINVGRVQGNDLMLPKGNVSKHHARLLFRDGRFIVTDLKSTNGTYVNGRKISQATIVREGDKIYIGDFVLRLETAAGAEASPDASYAPPAQADDSQGRSPARVGGLPRDPTPPPPQAAPGGPPPLPPQMPAMPSAPAVSSGPMASPQPTPPTGGPRNSADQSVSHYPLERDPDDSENAPEMRGAPVPRVPGPPRVPQADAKGRSGGDKARSSNQSGGPSPIRSTSPGVKPLPRETPQQAARRLALITLVDRVADVVDLAPLKRAPTVDEATTQAIDRAVREQAKAMRDEGEAPDGIDLELLARDALRELVGLGPIGPLLEEEDTLEIHVSRPDYVLAIKGGHPVLADPSFTSEDALARVVERLAHQSGEPWRPGEQVIERRLARGAYMVAIAPPAASTWVLSVRKRRRVETSLEDLVRAGAMSRAMAQFLEACLLARANVLVVGSGAGAVATVLGALASAAPPGERVAVLQDADEISIGQAQVIPLALLDRGARGAEAVRAASRLGADRMVIASLAGAVASSTVDAIAEGCEGVLAGVGAPSLRHGLARLASQIALAGTGASLDVARDAVGESFDVAVEVARAGDGRIHLQRVVELGGGDAKGVAMRDIFVLGADGTGEAAYVATGTVPRIAGEFAARGVKLDGGVFKRR